MTQSRSNQWVTNQRTFAFGALEPGETADMVWKVTAVRAGDYELGYAIAAGLGGETNAVNAAGEDVTGLLPVNISDVPILTQIDDKGNVVPLDRSEQLRLKLQEAESE